MKYLYLSSLFIIIGCVAQAQLRIVPQFGIETSKTSVSYNDASNFSPLGVKLSPHASLRLDYKFKKGHGPFVGVATSRSAVNYTFSNPETGKTDYIASRDQKQLRLEGGYQLSTKRIFLNKGGSKDKSTNLSRERTVTKSYSEYYNSGRCGSKSYRVAEVVTKNHRNKGSWVKIQPSAGMAFVPGASAAEITTSNQGSIMSHEYNAGNWKTAVLAGAGFAFGKNNSEKLIVSVNYLKGIGNLNTQTLTTTAGSKTTTTHLSSAVSNWNLRVGVPINLTKKTSPKKQVIIIEERKEIKETQEIKQSKEGKKCGGYMYRCRRAA